jgi:hypothetical protein
VVAALARATGKLAFLLVSLTVITGVSLLLFGSYILTWPVLRLSPTNRKVKAMVELAGAAMAALATLQTEDKGEHLSEHPGAGDTTASS